MRFYLIQTVIASSVGPTVAKSQCDQRVQQAVLGSQQDFTCSYSPTSVPTSPPNGANAAIPETGCNSSVFTPSYLASHNQNFTKTCNRNWAGNVILGMTVASWDLCMEACASYNHNRNTSNKGAVPCLGLTYVPSWYIRDWSLGNISEQSNCFLKNSVPDINSALNNLGFECVASVLKE